MAFATVQSWSETPASNTEIDGVNIDEGCNPSGINNAIRELMAQVAAWTGDDTIASATTTDLSTVNGQFVSITGTTTITGFGTVKAGWVKFLHFAGALTLTHNATSMILPGGNNITVAAGDTAAFVSLGSGNWRCLVPPGYISLSAANTWTSDQTFSSTDAGSGEAPALHLLRNSASPAASDNLAALQFEGKDSGGNTLSYGKIVADILDPTDTSEDGRLKLQTVSGGSLINALMLEGGGATFVVRVLVPDGTVSAPAIALANNTDTGIYSTGSDFRFTSNGADILSFGATGLNVNTTPGSGVFGVNNAVKNIITNGGQIDITNTTGGSCLRISRNGDGTAQSTHSGTTQTGSIAVTGGGTTTAYNTTSDERLKEFIGPYDPMKAIEIIRADPVRDYNWIKERGGAYGVGWGAQTSYSVSPDLATPGTEESDEWGVDKGARTPYLWATTTWLLDERDQMRKELDELRARLNAAGL